MIIELRDICKDYIQDKMVIPVLSNVSFSMKEGNTWRSWDLPDPGKPR